jgi:U3 small nucleolar RNA-associated protein 12
MGIKTYLKYKHQDTFGIINSSNIDFIPLPSSDGRIILAATGEDVSFWNIRQGVLVDVLRDPDNKHLVTAMSIDPMSTNLAVGYANGNVRIWNLAKKEVTTVFNGHNVPVTVLRFDPTGHMLVSGSKDTEIVLWDVVSEQCLYRLKGHKDEITDLNWLTIQTQIPLEDVDSDLITQYSDSYQVLPAELVSNATQITLLVSSSKDTTIKFWDLTLQHCLHTISSQSGEIWSFDILHHDPLTTTTSMTLSTIALATGTSPAPLVTPNSDNLNPSLTSSAILVAGSMDKFLRCWRLRTNLIAPSYQTEQSVLNSLFENVGIEFAGVIDRIGSTKRVNKVRFLSDGSPQLAPLDPTMNHTNSHPQLMSSSKQNANILMVYGVDKALDIYRVRPLDDKRQRQRRRFKRYKDKLSEMSAKVTQKKIPIQMYQDAEKDLPPIYLPTDDFEICAPFRLEERMTNFAYFTGKTTSSIIPNKKALQNSSLKKSQHSTLHSLPTEFLTLQSYCGFADNTIQICQFNLTPLVKLQNESLTSDGSIPSENQSVVKTKYSLNTPGHRAPVRKIQLSSDDSLLMSVGGTEIKFWNMKTHSCLRTLNLYPLYHETSGDVIKDSITSAIFVPGNKHVLVGTKQGYIDLYEIASGLLLNREPGEVGQPIWAIDLSSNGRSFASTCGKQVWFWSLDMVDITDEEMEYFSSMTGSTGASLRQQKLSFEQTRSLQLTDEVLCLKHSPDGRYIAAGLLDSTVRIFHVDTLNFFLSLYGHKLPVLTLDFSDDSTMIITGSNDKSVKIWGSDFGDLKRSLHAHDNSVMQVKFQPHTHFFFSVGKDFHVKYWDADRFKKIMSLPPHQSEALSLSITSNGRYVITAATDRSIKRFYQSEEAIVPEEEEEAEALDEMVDSSAEALTAGTSSTVSTSNRIGQILGSGFGAALTDSEELWAKSLRTKDVIGLTEYLLDALERCKNEMENWEKYHELVRTTRHERHLKYQATHKMRQTILKGKEIDVSKMTTIEKIKFEQERSTILAAVQTNTENEPLDASDIPQPPPNPIFLGKTPAQYMLSMVRIIKPNHLHTILVSLSFDYALLLIKLLSIIIQQGTSIELCTKTVLFLLKIHQTQLITTMSRSYIELLTLCRDNIRLRLDATRQMIGSNIAAFQYLNAYMTDKQLQNGQNGPKSMYKIAEEDVDKILGRTRDLKSKLKKQTFNTKAHKRQRTGIKRLKKVRGGV